MKLLDRWKVLISGISLLPMAGTTLAQAGHLSLADANWQPNDKLQPRYLPIRSMRQTPSTSMRHIARTVRTDPTVRTALTTAAQVAIAHLATTAHPLPVPEATVRRPQAATASTSRLALPAVQARALQRAARRTSRKATWSPVCRPR